MSKMDLIISDAEFLFAEKTLMAYISNLEEVGNAYNKLIQSISESALEDPNITAKLGSLSGLMSTVCESVTETSNSLKGKAKSFIETVDEADQFMY